jgi:hypothetical protein
MNVIRTFLLGLLVLPLSAQSTSFSAGGALILGLDSYKKAVNSSTGLLVNGAWDTTVLKTDIPARLTLGFGLMPGKETNGLTTSLKVLQFSGDILIDTSVEGLRGVVGLSVNKYYASLKGIESQSAFDTDHHFPFHDVAGIKGGLRLGLEYSLSQRVTCEALLQATELAGRQRNDTQIRDGGINPSWVQFGARYKF